MSVSRILLPNHADTRYREALGRLHFLLHEYDSSGTGGSDAGSLRRARRSDGPATDGRTEEVPCDVAARVSQVLAPEQRTRSRSLTVQFPPEFLGQPPQPEHVLQQDVFHLGHVSHPGHVLPPTPALRHLHVQIPDHLPPQPGSRALVALRPAPPYPTQQRSPHRTVPLPPPSLPHRPPAMRLVAPTAAAAGPGERLDWKLPGRGVAEVGTSTSELADTDVWRARQLGRRDESWHHQDELVAQLELENRALREMMDELQEHVQELVVENRQLASDLQAQTQLVSASVHESRPPPTPFAAGPESAPPGDGGEPPAGVSPSVGDATAAPAPAPAAGLQVAELEKTRREVARLTEHVQEHERWLEGGYKQQQRQHQEERDQLTEALGTLQARVTELQRREEEALHKVKQSLLLSEQAQLEKAQAQNTATALRQDLEAQQQRREQLISEHERRVAAAHSDAERAVHESFDRQGAQLAEQVDKLAQLETERQLWRRLEQELRGAAQAQRQAADDVRLDAERVASRHQQELAQEQRCRHNAETQLEAARLAMQRTERDTLLQTDAIQTELASLRKQLASAEAGLSAAHRDRIRLQEQVNALERQTSGSELERAAAERSGAEDVRVLALRGQSRERRLLEDVAEILAQSDAKVAQLEALCQSQAAVDAGMQSECAALTGRLEAAQTARQQLTDTVQALERRLAETEAARLRLETRCYQYGRQHEQHLLRAEDLERELRDSMGAAGVMAEEHQRLLAERRELHDRLMLRAT